MDDENNLYRQTFDHRSGDLYNQYSYDALDRLTGVTVHDSDTEAFAMDDLGNREFLLDAINTMNKMERGDGWMEVDERTERIIRKIGDCPQKNR